MVNGDNPDVSAMQGNFPASSEKSYTERLCCSPSTRKKLDACIETYKNHNKDARYRKITPNEILNRICDFYLED